MSTSYRNLFLLASCQALLLTNAAGLISMNGLVGYALVDTKTLATLGATTYVLGSALSTMAMSLWMAEVGRRLGGDKLGRAAVPCPDSRCRGAGSGAVAGAPPDRLLKLTRCPADLCHFECSEKSAFVAIQQVAPIGLLVECATRNDMVGISTPGQGLEGSPGALVNFQ